MVSPKLMAVLAILILIFAVSAWSKLRFVDDDDFAPQRIPLNEHPAFQKSN